MNRVRTFFLALIAIGLCGLIGFLAVYAYLPLSVSETFGPASPQLSDGQRYWLMVNLFVQEPSLTIPVNPGGRDQVFRIEPGELPGAIAGRLERGSLIPDSSAFQNYLIYRGFDTQIQAGDFTLSPAMRPIDIAAAFLDATPASVPFSILAGWRVEEIAAALPTSGLNIDPQVFLTEAQKPPNSFGFNFAIPASAGIEGFLLPGLYEFSRDTTVDQFIGTFLRNFEVNYTAEVSEAIGAQGLSLFEAVILASIVEREAVVAAERSLIASVFLNRFRQGIKLDADPTVQYSLGYDDSWGWWKSPLSLEDLGVVSPFNTYQNGGLPPGPIASPSLDSLRAVAFPEVSNYLFFRAACDGSGLHLFAENFEAHQANACR